LRERWRGRRLPQPCALERTFAPLRDRVVMTRCRPLSVACPRLDDKKAATGTKR
jgi:hypothetical protein